MKIKVSIEESHLTTWNKRSAATKQRWTPSCCLLSNKRTTLNFFVPTRDPESVPLSAKFHSHSFSCVSRYWKWKAPSGVALTGDLSPQLFLTRLLVRSVSFLFQGGWRTFVRGKGFANKRTEPREVWLNNPGEARNDVQQRQTTSYNFRVWFSIQKVTAECNAFKSLGPSLYVYLLYLRSCVFSSPFFFFLLCLSVSLELCSR